MDAPTKLAEACSNPRMPREDEESVKCTLCSKPIPAKDAFKKDGKLFCGVPAAAQFAAQQSHYNEYQDREKGAKFRKMIRNLVLLVILAAIAGAGFMYYQKNPDKVKALFGKAKAATTETLDSATNRGDESKAPE